MSDRLTVTIEGKDGLSKVFQEVTRGADKFADSLEKAGNDGAKGLDNIGKGAKKASVDVTSAGKSFSTFQQETESAAQNLKGLSEAFDFVTKAGTENQRLTDAIGRAYGDASGDLLEFADHLQDTTRFSNEAAESAALYGISLKNNYGIGADSIQLLLERSADLAQINGIELPDAMSRLTSAIRGEGEAAELLGLNMSETAIAAAALKAGLTNWNDTGANAMTDAEKAAFRLQVALEQSTFAVGAAGDATGSAAGKIAQLSNTFQDVVASASEMLGPIPAVGGALAGVASQAFTVVGGGAALINMFKSAATSATLLAVATNPVVLAIVGIGAAVGIGLALWNKYTDNVDENAVAMERLAAETAETASTIERLNLSGNFKLADMITEQTEEATAAIEAFNASVSAQFADAEWFSNIDFAGIYDLEQAFGHFTDFLNKDVGSAFQQWATETKALGADTATILQQAAAGNANTLQVYGKQIQDSVTKWLEYLKIDPNEASAVQDSLNNLFELYSNPNIDSTKLDSVISNLFNQFEAGALSSEQLVAALDSLYAGIGSGVDPFGVLSNSATTLLQDLTDVIAPLEDIVSVVDGLSQQKMELEFQGLDTAALDVQSLADAFLSLKDPVFETVQIFDHATGSFTTGVNEIKLSAAGLDQASFAYDKLNDALASGDYDNARLLADYMQAIADADTPDEAAAATYELVLNLKDYAIAAGDASFVTDLLYGKIAEGTAKIDAARSSIDEYNASIDAVKAASIEWLSQGDNIIDFLIEFQKNGKNAGYSALLMADNLDTAAVALDGVLALFDQIDALGSRSSAAGAIADFLFGEGGDPYDALGPLVDLLDAGRLSQEQFNQTVESGVAIQESNLRVQEDLNLIRANQLPLLEEQQLAYEEQIQALSEMSAAEQQHALFLMDSGNQAKIASVFSTAYSASLGEIPESVASEIILSSAQADPILKEYLLQAGLIEENPITGEITVNFPDGPTVLSTLQEIDQSIAILVAVLDNDPLTVVINAEDNAEETVDKYMEPKEVPPIEVEIKPRDNVATPLSSYQNHEPIVIDVEFKVSSGGLGHDSGAPVPETITITTELKDEASDGLASIAKLADSFDGNVTTFVAELDDDATGPINDVSRLHESQDGERSVLIIDLRDDASKDIDAVARRHANVDGDVSTLKINANTADAEDGVQWARNLNGDVLATSYINVVTRYFDSGGGPGHERHGGVPGFAHGGMVPFWAGEAGPELAHFATGGTALLPFEGMYAAPAGTYISPAPSSAASIVGAGIRDVHVHVHGNVIGMDDFTGQVMDQLFPILEEAAFDNRRSMGRA